MTGDDRDEVKRLFIRAMHEPESRRYAFVQSATASEEVRREVASLLVHHSTETLIDSADHQSVRETPTISASPSAQRTESGSSSGLSRFSVRTLGLLVGWIALCLGLWWLHLRTTRSAIEQAELSGRDVLQAGLDCSELELDAWCERQHRRVQQLTSATELVAAVKTLSRLTEGPPAEVAQALRDSTAQATLKTQIGEWRGADPPVAYTVWGRDLTLLADGDATSSELGVGVPSGTAQILAKVFRGEFVFCLPEYLRATASGSADQRLELGFVGPVVDENGWVIGGLSVRWPELSQELQELLDRRRFSTSVQTYAMTRDGVRVTRCRGEDEVLRLQQVSAGGPQDASRGLQIADPGGDLTAGYRPPIPASEWPLTRMAAHASRGEAGVDVTGYRDYRGVTVLGAWRWITTLDLAVACEVESNDVKGPLLRLQRIGTLGLGTVTLAGPLAWWLAPRLGRRLRGSQRVGAYVMERLIGEGGAGQVFLATHDLLKRPTAVKRLRPDRMTPLWHKRFEREVQAAARLCHPNTVAVYDFGISDDGQFYYAMEYIDGMTLAELIQTQGRLSPERTRYLLMQVCGSLREAHLLGMTHQDVKPQNIMVSRAGGKPDFVKVLDFGLMRPIDMSQATETGSRVAPKGTPQYMSPERLLQPEINDPRSDIYSLGAVAYNMLTGRDIFPATGEDVYFHILNTLPPSISALHPDEIPVSLDYLVCRCLSKAPDERPASIDEFMLALDDVVMRGVWGEREAEIWWVRRQEVTRIDASS